MGDSLPTNVTAPAGTSSLVRSIACARCESDLVDDVLEYVSGCVCEEGLEGLEVNALLEDRFQRSLRLGFEVVRRVRAEVHGEQPPEHVEDGGGLCVVGAVAADLAEGPGAGGLDVVLGLAHERVHERRDALGHHHPHRQRLAEGRNVAQGHDARQPRVAARLVHVVHHRRHTSRIHNKPRELRRVLRDFADARRRIFSYLQHHYSTQLAKL